MTSDNPDLLQQLFSDALAVPAPSRASFLETACGDNEMLRQNVASLLSAHERVGDFLESATIAPARQQIAGLSGGTIGSTIGRYELIDLIGEGGFGSVFLARQTSPVQREVALKIIKLGMDTQQVVARFEAERQTLANMDHPSIARVYDGGSTDAGRPFFVMELVRGKPLTRFCDDLKLGIDQRIELLITILQAVEHAHQKGIIHRDLKPSNIMISMVDGHPVPKIIDFGIAKATQFRADGVTLTEQAAVMGTPAYMSPEQARSGGRDIDTRSDIYSLGVLLYELLTGETPIDAKRIRDASFGEVPEIIQNAVFQIPSTRIRASRDLRISRELDWITCKCLEKERDRRYRSAGELAADLQRYLDGDAVLASPPGKIYHLRKWMKRNRVALSVAAVILCSLAAALVVSLVALTRVSQQKVVAQQANQTSTDINAFFNELLSQADPDVNPEARTMTIVQLLDRAAQDVGEKFASRPLVEAKIRSTVGSAYQSFGETSKAQQQLSRAKTLFAEIPNASAEDEIQVGLLLVAAQLYSGTNEQTITLSRQLYEQASMATISASKRLYTAAQHSRVLSERGRYIEAEKVASDTLASLPGEVREKEFLACAELHIALGNAMRAQQRNREAETSFRSALELLRRNSAGDSPRIAAVTNSVAAVVLVQNRHEEAETLLRDAYDMNVRIFGENNSRAISSLHDIACTVSNAGNSARAEPIFRDVHRRAVQAFGPDWHTAVMAQGNLGNVISKLGRSEEAIDIIEEALERSRRTLGNSNATTFHIYRVMIECVRRLGRADLEIELCKELFFALQDSQLGSETIVSYSGWWGHALTVYKRYAEARQPLLDGLEVMRKLGHSNHISARTAMLELAEGFDAEGKTTDAAEWRLRAAATTQPATTSAAPAH